ncbi:hypothetical protein ACIA03_28890 [Nocardioides sp. NPDC051685]|uniref:hypothetical protein n=1 Tax=Nocardioides sp. NPDC051685 TaxID=3364334 RepID=UPI00378FCD66
MTRDLAADLFRHGYHAIPDARRRAGEPPACPVKLLGDDALVVSGPASVRRFYDSSLIRRSGAVPATSTRSSSCRRAGEIRPWAHRCPGEPSTIAMIAATVEVFAGATWSVVERGSTYPRIPTRERLRIRIG